MQWGDDCKMVNDLSLEEIKDSIEYQWRKQQINTLLAIWLFIALITLFIPSGSRLLV